MFFKKNVIVNLLHHSGVTYPVPSNITYWWNFGVLALVCLIIQVITGIFLAMHFVANADLAFISVEHIMRDIQYGWLLRYVHSNGASMFFLVVYVHLFRGLYYGSYSAPRNILWCTGVIILLIMILTAFMGYVLPWGQMSFWAATVITNLVSAIPYVGNDILIWLWGGFAIDNPTLNRFFSLHYLLPFVLIGLVGLHLVYLHENGSNNALGTIYNGDKIPFTPYFTIKDIFGVLLFFVFFSYFIFFEPVVLGHPDNFIPANPLVTPNHIVPEWYFLPFYAILRAVPYKLFGFILLIAAIIVLLIFPFLCKGDINSGFLRPLYRKFFWIFFFDCLLLGWIGGKAIEEPFYVLGQLCTIYYFCHFLIIIPAIIICEKVYSAWHDSYEYTLLSFWDAPLLCSAIIAERLKKKKSKVKLTAAQQKLILLNRKYTVNFFSFEQNENLIKYNNMSFFRGLICILILMQGPLLFNDGDRIPNTTILIVMFFGYVLFTSQDVFEQALATLLLIWKKLTTNLIIVLHSSKYWLIFNVALALNYIINFIAIKNIKSFLNTQIKKYYSFFILSYTAYLFLLLKIINKFRFDLIKPIYIQYWLAQKQSCNTKKIILLDCDTATIIGVE